MSAKPVTVGGVAYPSIAAAARAVGLTKQAVASYLKNVSAGRATQPRDARTGRAVATGPRARVVELDGVVGTINDHAARLDVPVKAAYRRAVRKHGRLKVAGAVPP